LEVHVSVLQRHDDLDQPIGIAWQRRSVEGHANRLSSRHSEMRCNYDPRTT
jgi:hypothetical protein